VAIPVIGVSIHEDYLVPVLVASGVGVIGGGLILVAMAKKGGAKERMELILNRGRIKGYIGASVFPSTKSYSISFRLAF
jgi:hypothetical protein